MIDNVKLAIFLLLFLSDTVCPGQDFKTLNIWLGDKQSISEDYVLILNNRRITSLRPKELVVYQTYTSDPINIEIIFAKTGILKYSDQFELDESMEYFFQANTSGYPAKAFIERLTLNEASRYFEHDTFFSKKRIFEEDINNPIGKISEDYRKKQPTQGSGFLVNDEGYILTNFHVVEDARKILVSGIDGDFKTSFEALLIASDRLLDIAVLKIESKLVKFSVPPYAFSHSEEVKVGETVGAFGYPIANALGYELKVTDGIVNSTTGFKNSISTLQFSAPVQPGNSGGPLINSKGEIIGLVSSKISSSATESISYALKANYIKFFLTQASNITFTKPSSQKMPNASLVEIVDRVKDFIFIIQTE